MKTNIGFLTSSRADFGIYIPLLEKMRDDKSFEISIIAFGTHLSKFHGYTINEIINEGYDVKYSVETMLCSDTQEANSMSIGLTLINFANFWKLNSCNFDFIFCLGDRYEMFAAVYSGLPFNIKFVHLHGGETTLGALDNVYRHAITLASTIHFTATADFKNKVSQLINSTNDVYNVGALGLSNLSRVKMLSIREIKEKWNVDMSIPTILFTYHPETMDLNNVEKKFQIVIESLRYFMINFQIIITLPNADISGTIIRQMILNQLGKLSNIFIFENLGSQSYLSVMSKSAFVFGNSSSGIIEAASFNKFFINIGVRQKGRAFSENTVNVDYSFDEIMKAFEKVKSSNFYFSGENIYYQKDSEQSIINILKNKLIE